MKGCGMEFIVKPYHVSIYNEEGELRCRFDLIDFMMRAESISNGWERKGAEYMPEIVALLSSWGFKNPEPTIAEAWQVVRHCSKMWESVKKNIDASPLQSQPLDSIL